MAGLSGMLGIPSESELQNMLGFVDDEDRANWDRLEENKARRQEVKGPGIVSKAVTPGLGLMEQALSGRVTSAHTDEFDNQRASRPVETVTRTQSRFADEPQDSRDEGPSY